MLVEHFPFCCTAAVLGSFGEHGEESEVSVEKIKELVHQTTRPVRDLGGRVVGEKRIVFAVSVDPKNVAMLKEAGFKVVDSYNGIQGRVHVLTLHPRGH